jgi:WD40 repeat protein
MEPSRENRFLLTCAMTRHEHCPEWDRAELAEDVDRVVKLFCGDFLLLPDRYEHADVLGDSPTSVELLDRLRDFCTASERRPDDYVVVYLTGHGEILDDGDHVILASDTSPSDLLRRSVPTAEIVKRALTGTKVRRLLLLLDTCYAGTGGADLAREALRRIRPGSPHVGKDALRSGVVLVAATHQYEQALPGAFTKCLDRAARSLAAAGYAPPTLRIPALIDSVNVDPGKPASQSAVCHLLGLDADEPAFLPNPRFRPTLVNMDLLEQERARYAEQRGAHLRDIFLPATQWFTGRHAALTDLARWLGNPAATPRAVVVTGNAGSGKTALLGLLAALSDPDRAPAVPRDGLPAGLTVAEGLISETIYAGTMTTGQVRDWIAAAAGLHANTTQELIDGLKQLGTGALVVLIDALDEAADPSGLIRGLLGPLIRQRPGNLRLLLGTRPHLLTTDLLGKPGTGDYLPVDLDSGQYADPASIRRYIRRILLSDDPLDSAYRPSGLYRAAAADLLDAVTEAIGEAAGASFLVARITATTEATVTWLPNPKDPAWRQALPRRAGQAMRRDLRLRLRDQADKAARLLLPLAYSQGSGLPWEGIWPRLADALSPGRGYGDEDLIWLRRAAGSYAVEGLEGGRSVYRLYHQALAEHLLEGRDETADHATIAHVLAAQVPPGPAGQLDWFSNSTHPYVHTHLASHAARGRCLDSFLDDPGYLLAAARPQLHAALPSAVSDQAKRHAHAYRRAAHHLDVETHQEWASYLELAARCNGAPLLADAVSRCFQRSWSACWASWRPTVTPLYTATGHTGSVNAIAVAQLPHGPVAVSGSDDGTVRVWDLETGALVGRPFTGHTAAVRAVAVTELQSRSVAISASNDHSVQIWDLETGAVIRKPITNRIATVHTVAVIQLKGHPVAILGSDNGSVSVWDLAVESDTGPVAAVLAAPVRDGDDGEVSTRGLAARGYFTGHAGAVRALAVAKLQGRPVVATASAPPRSPTAKLQVWPFAAYAPAPPQSSAYADRGNCEVKVWDLNTRGLIRDRMASHYPTKVRTEYTGEVLAVAIAELKGCTLLLSGWDDGSVRVWDLTTGKVANEPFTGHTAAVLTVAVAELQGRPVVISGSEDGSVRVWNLATGDVVGEPFIGKAAVRSVAAAELQGRPVVVSGSTDGSVRVWDLASGIRLRMPFTGHSSAVRSVAAAELPGRPVVVSGSTDGSVRVWDLATGFEVGKPFTGHTAAVLAVAVAELQRRRVVISGSDDGSVRVWDLATGDEVGMPVIVGKPFIGRTAVVALTVAELRGRPVVVSASRDGSLQAWDPATGVEVGKPFIGRTAGVLALTVAELRGRPVVVSASRDGSLQAWDLATGVEVGKPITGHTRDVLAVAAAELDGQWVVVSGSADQSVRIWDLATGTALGEQPIKGHTNAVLAVTIAELSGRPVVVSGSADRSVRVWDMASGAALRELVRGRTEWVRAIAKAELSGRTVVVSGSDDSSLCVRDLATGAEVGQLLTCHNGEVLAVAAGELHGRWVIVSGSADCSIRVWDLATGALVRQPITGHTADVLAVTIAELSGRPVVVSGSADRSVRVWDLATGAPVGKPIIAHSGAVRTVSAAKLHERPVVVSGSDDGSVRVWDLETGAPARKPFLGHTDSVHTVAVAYAQGRTMVASGGADRSILIWDLETGRINQRIKNLHGPVIDIDLGSGGRKFRALVDDSSGQVLEYAFTLANHIRQRVASYLPRPKRRGRRTRGHRSPAGALSHLDFPRREVTGYGTRLSIHAAASSQIIDIDAVIHGIEAISPEKLVIATSQGIVMLKVVASDT